MVLALQQTICSQRALVPLISVTVSDNTYPSSQIQVTFRSVTADKLVSSSFRKSKPLGFFSVSFLHVPSSSFLLVTMFIPFLFFRKRNPFFENLISIGVAAFLLRLVTFLCWLSPLIQIITPQKQQTLLYPDHFLLFNPEDFNLSDLNLHYDMIHFRAHHTH